MDTFTTELEKFLKEMENEMGDSKYEELIKEHLSLINAIYRREVIGRLTKGIDYLVEQEKNGTFEQGVKALRKVLLSPSRIELKEPLA